MYRFLLLLASAAVVLGQAADPSYPFLEKAYAATKARQYAEAVTAFEQAIAARAAAGATVANGSGAASANPTGAASARAGVRKDFAYALLKTGDNEAARDQFAEASRLDPGDAHAALEYAFLCYETKKPVEARRTFQRLRLEGNMTAAQEPSGPTPGRTGRV